MDGFRFKYAFNLITLEPNLQVQTRNREKRDRTESKAAEDTLNEI
jgi:hypothetical protein